MLTLTCATMFVAAIVQRITGLGFALTATAPMVLMYGPDEGVKAGIVTGIVVSAVMVVTMLRDVSWRRSGMLVLGGALAAPLAAWLTFAVPSPVLLVLVGLAALLSLVGGRFVSVARGLTGVRGALFTGAASGFLHVTSGLSGPPLVVYGVQSRWEQRSFVASLQIVFIAFHVFTLGLRGLPAMPLGEIGILACAVVLGLGAGSLLVRAVPALWARRGMLAIAWAGTIAVLVRGALELVGPA